mmetsp:Transcript_1457/g.2419  ORF Transcript_1457/g.2419 Transcript_1457/m.2419 type:complete len:87 (-) Transcript_1457:720-980(-)
MGKASKKPAKTASAPNKSGDSDAGISTDSLTQVRRSKRALDPTTPAQENPFFYVAVGMVLFAVALLFQLSDKIYARYFQSGKVGEL